MPSAFNIDANVNLNAASVNASAKQIKQALGRITGQASEFQKSLDASTARVFAFGATTAVLNGVTQSFKKLISTTIEVEKKLVEINSIFQATEATFNRFRNSIFKVAKETGQAFGTVAEGAAELARQGLSAEETAKRLKASLVLTRISGLDAEKSVKALTAAINGFTSAGLTANQIVNKMVAVDTAFAVSAQDLAEAFSRAGSTAEDAGVSFNELLGLVTAVEQRTARGGAVIGNAFKSIFTRLARGGTIDQLRELGVEIDATQTGIQKLSALSAALDKIADPTKASAIKELAGGVFQINVVSAALKDLSSETGIFAQAAVTASNATNEAFEKNAALNKTIAAQINSLVVGLTNLAEKIGKITFGPLLESLLGLANKFTEFLDKALDPEKGNVFIKGLFKTIGQFLSGPAVVIFTAAFVKIFGLVAKFARDGLKSIFLIGSQTQKIQTIEAGLVDLLARDNALRKIIGSTTATQAQKEQAVIAAIQRENALLTQQAAIMRQLATAAAARGVSGFGAGGFTGKGGKKFAGGFPRRGGYGYNAMGAKNPRAERISAQINGKQENVVVNSEEDIFHNVGRNGDSAIVPRYLAAGGFIPNYANLTLSQLSVGQIGRLKAGNNVKVGNKSYTAANLSSKERASLSVVAKKEAIKKKTTNEPQPPAPIKVKGGVSAGAFMTPTGGKKGGRLMTTNTGIYTKDKIPYHWQASPAFRQYSPSLKKITGNYLTQSMSGSRQRHNTNLTEKSFVAAANMGQKYAQELQMPKGKANLATKKTVRARLEQEGGNKGAYGAVRGLAGASFEAAIYAAMGLVEYSSKTRTKKGKGLGRGDFDIESDHLTANPIIKKLFRMSGGVQRGDLKIGAQQGLVNSFASKVLKGSPEETAYRDKYKAYKTELAAWKKNKSNTRAAGYIPNFARGGLGAAIERERNAGVPVNRIRAHFDENGMPQAVTNRDDEPFGLRSVGGGRAGGFVPNFADEILVKNKDGKFVPMDDSSMKSSSSSSTEKKPKKGGKDLGMKAFFAFTALAQGVNMWSASIERGNAKTQLATEAKIKEIQTSDLGMFAQMEAIDAIKAETAAKIESTNSALELSSGLNTLLTASFAASQVLSLLPENIKGMISGGFSPSFMPTGGKQKGVRGIPKGLKILGTIAAIGTAALGWHAASKAQKSGEISDQRATELKSGAVGGGAGALAGAAIGSMFAPVIGTIIGGIIGGIAGSMAGEAAPKGNALEDEAAAAKKMQGDATKGVQTYILDQYEGMGASTETAAQKWNETMRNAAQTAEGAKKAAAVTAASATLKTAYEKALKEKADNDKVSASTSQEVAVAEGLLVASIKKLRDAQHWNILEEKDRRQAVRENIASINRLTGMQNQRVKQLEELMARALAAPKEAVETANIQSQLVTPRGPAKEFIDMQKAGTKAKTDAILAGGQHRLLKGTSDALEKQKAGARAGKWTEELEKDLQKAAKATEAASQRMKAAVITASVTFANNVTKASERIVDLQSDLARERNDKLTKLLEGLGPEGRKKEDLDIKPVEAIVDKAVRLMSEAQKMKPTTQGGRELKQEKIAESARLLKTAKEEPAMKALEKTMPNAFNQVVEGSLQRVNWNPDVRRKANIENIKAFEDVQIKDAQSFGWDAVADRSRRSKVTKNPEFGFETGLYGRDKSKVSGPSSIKKAVEDVRVARKKIADIEEAQKMKPSTKDDPFSESSYASLRYARENLEAANKVYEYQVGYSPDRAGKGRNLPPENMKRAGGDRWAAIFDPKYEKELKGMDWWDKDVTQQMQSFPKRAGSTDARFLNPKGDRKEVTAANLGELRPDLQRATSSMLDTVLKGLQGGLKSNSPELIKAFKEAVALGFDKGARDAETGITAAEKVKADSEKELDPTQKGSVADAFRGTGIPEKTEALRKALADATGKINKVGLGVQGVLDEVAGINEGTQAVMQATREAIKDVQDQILTMKAEIKGKTAEGNALSNEGNTN